MIVHTRRIAAATAALVAALTLGLSGCTDDGAKPDGGSGSGSGSSSAP